MVLLLAAAALAAVPDVGEPVDWGNVVTEAEYTCQTFVPTVDRIVRLEIGISMPDNPDATTLAQTVADLRDVERALPAWNDQPFAGDARMRPMVDIPPSVPAELASTARWLELDVGDGLPAVPGQPHLLCFGAARLYGAGVKWLGNDPGSYADGKGGSKDTRDLVFQVYGFGAPLEGTSLEVRGDSRLVDVTASGTVTAADLVVTGSADLGPSFSVSAPEPTHLDAGGLFGQMLAQATCAALRENAGATFAVRRTCPSSTDCNKVCKQADAGSCIESLHVYSRDAATEDAVKGLQIHRYDSCTTARCGPNYCCCAP